MRELPRSLLCLLLLFTAAVTSGRQWIVFYGIKYLSPGSLTGHAYVQLVQEDSIMQQTRADFYGFYPQPHVDNPEAWDLANAADRVLDLVSNAGVVKDDVLRNKDVRLIMEVPASVLDSAYRMANTWRAAQYRLTHRNCVSFIKAIADVIPGMRKPYWGSPWPYNYVWDLKRMNEDLEVTGMATFPGEQLVQGPPDHEGLTCGTELLFVRNMQEYSQCPFTDDDLNHLYRLAELQVDSAQHRFYPGKDAARRYDLYVHAWVVDMNGDGDCEVFLSADNEEYYGRVGLTRLFMKRNGTYVQVLTVNGSLGALLTQHGGYPDLLVTGPGLQAPTFLWNGQIYARGPMVSVVKGQAPPMRDFRDYAQP